MDFSLARIIEVFEERFGRKASTALIVLVALAIASWALKAIVANFIVPSWNLAMKLAEFGALSEIEGWVVSITKRQIAATIGWALTVSLGSALYVKLLKWRAYKSIRNEVTRNPDKYLGALSEKMGEIAKQKVYEARDQAISDLKAKVEAGQLTIRKD